MKGSIVIKYFLLCKKRSFFLACFFVCVVSLSFGSVVLAHTFILKVQINPVGTIAPLPDDGQLSNAMHTQTTISISSHDIWVGGTYDVCASGGGMCHAGGTASFFEHYNGHTWAVSYPPNLAGDEIIDSMAEPSSNIVYAVGTYETSFFASYYPDVLKWSNGIWTRVTVPLPSDYNGGYSDSYSGFRSVVAISALNIWAAGQYTDANAQLHPLLEHYNGSTWSIVSVPSTLTEIDSLQRQGSTPIILAFGSDGTTTRVLSLRA